MNKLVLPLFALALLVATPALGDNMPEEGKGKNQQSMERDYSQKGYDRQTRQTYEDMDEERTRTAQRMERSGIVAADALQNRNVVDENGEDIGEIEKVYINSRTGDVEYVLLNWGGVLGLGEQQAIVPFQALRLDPQENNVKLNKTLKEIKDAPDFDEDKLYDDENYRKKVDREWGADS